MDDVKIMAKSLEDVEKATNAVLETSQTLGRYHNAAKSALLHNDTTKAARELPFRSSQ